MSTNTFRLDHVNIVVADLERSLAFYVGHLGMEQTFAADLTGEWIATLSGLPEASARCAFCTMPGGGTRLELLEYRMPSGADLAENSLPHTRGVRHLALEVDDLDAWYARLSEAGIHFVSTPVAVPFVVGGNRKRLCYCHDPDGVLVELASYEPVEP
jgi:glyoxylase I family protein